MTLHSIDGFILRRLFKVHGLFFRNIKRSSTCFKGGNRKKMLSCNERTTSGRANITPPIKIFQSFNEKNKNTKPENNCLFCEELVDEYRKRSNDKKKEFMEDLIGDNSSKNSNNSDDKPVKEKCLTVSMVSALTICLTLSVNFKIIVQIINGNQTFGPLEFPNFQKPRGSKNIVTSDDDNGRDESSAEYIEIIEHLREREKYVRFGEKLPKDALIVGSPGTSKTLLARAVDSEANVPFFHKSGSEFDEILVGRGAKRVRDLFKTARSNVPCIIFIDEIDSFGSKRTSSDLHSPVIQTINQLLTEMDRINKNDGIIVIGATNRLEDLDKALLKTRRFDICVNYPKPDLTGCIEIFKHYLDKVPYRNINIDVLAKTTIGFTTADISNVVNKAALKAAAEGCHYVMQKHLENASDRVIMGLARIKGKLPGKESNIITAYREAGHTFVDTSYATPLLNVIIIPRQNSLSHTSFMSEKDKHHSIKAEISAQIKGRIGGYVAEKPIFGRDCTTTGAPNDSKKSTSSTKTRTKKFGMSGNIGSRKYKFYICQKSDGNDVSPQATNEAGLEIDKIMNKSYARENSNLTKNEKDHKRSAKGFLKNRTLTEGDVQSIPKGKPPGRKPTDGLSGVKIKRKK